LKLQAILAAGDMDLFIEDRTAPGATSEVVILDTQAPKDEATDAGTSAEGTAADADTPVATADEVK
jgi:hypothetical protein